MSSPDNGGCVAALWVIAIICLIGTVVVLMTGR